MVKVKEAPRTRERILAIALEHGMAESVFVSEIKRNRCNGAFKPGHWDKYVQVITKWEFFNRSRLAPPPPPCPVCGGEQFHDHDLVGKFKSHSPMTGLRCHTVHHFYMVMEADRIAEKETIPFELALEKVKMKEAEHEEVPVVRS
jgi:hypothetical protein